MYTKHSLQYLSLLHYYFEELVSNIPEIKTKYLCYISVHLSEKGGLHQADVTKHFREKIMSILFTTYQIYITQFIQPKVIYSCSTSRKVVLFKASV